MQAATDHFRSYLASKGLRCTQQRSLILKEVMSAKGHFEAEDIFVRLRRKRLGISQTSVFRTLKILVEGGIVRKTPCPQMRGRYECVFGHAHHDHLVCIECGAVVEFENATIEELQEKVARKHGFDIVGHRLLISGLCARCRAKTRAHKSGTSR